jgi:CheY-like chemotaxis protein
MGTGRERLLLLCVASATAKLSTRKAALEENGYAVLIATSPAEALCTFAKHPVALVLTDQLCGPAFTLSLAAEFKRLAPQTPLVLLANTPPGWQAGPSLVDQFVCHDASHATLLATLHRLLAAAASPARQVQAGAYEGEQA